MTAILERPTEAPALVRPKPPCEVRIPGVTNEDGDEAYCPNEATWSATAECPLGHPNTDLVCDAHKLAIQLGISRFVCNRCGTVATAVTTTWTRL